MITPKLLSAEFWLIIVMVYYFVAVFIPIDKIIGKVYPIFGVCPISSGDIAYRSARLTIADECLGHFRIGHTAGIVVSFIITLCVLCSFIVYRKMRK